MDSRINRIQNEREEKCIPRLECERTHATVDKTLTEIKDICRQGFANMDSKIGDVHERVNEVERRPVK